MDPTVLALLAEKTIPALAGEALKRVLAAASKEEGLKVEVDKARTVALMHQHMMMTARWASEIAFRSMQQPRSLPESFVNLECQLGYWERSGPANASRRITSTDLLNTERHVILLGRPGAGKSTTLQRLTLSLLQHHERDAHSALPYLVRLRELSEGGDLLDHVCALLGFTITVEKSAKKQVHVSHEELRIARTRAIASFFDGANLRVMIDGLDEVPVGQKARTEASLDALMRHSQVARYVVTCRTGAYDITLPGSDVYVLLPLDRQRVRKFAVRWLGPREADRFLSALQDSPYAGAESLPLTIAHLCTVFQHRGAIPDRPRSVYRLVVRLLLEDWNAQHRIIRPSAYANFDADRKLDFLQALSYELTLRGRRGVFSHDELQRAYKNIHSRYRLPITEAEAVAREIESHTGLVVQSAFETYEFAHLSIQEFLAGSHLSLLSTISLKLVEMPEEHAVATALSSRPDLYLEGVVHRLADSSPPSRGPFARRYLERLITEKPDMPGERWTGWNLLALAVAASSETEVVNGTEVQHSIDPILASLDRDPPLREAVTTALATASVKKGAEDHRVDVRLDSLTVVSKEARVLLGGPSRQSSLSLPEQLLATHPAN